MMEAKVKQDFDLKGEVYENFRDNKDVFLTNAQIYEIFESFWIDTCSSLVSEKNPVLYIVGAQPGAGKTGLVEKLESDLKIKSLVGDVYRELHPNAKKFTLDKNYSSYTGPINGVIGMLCKARCIDRKISFIQETSMGHLDSVFNIINQANKNGFTISLNLLIVKKYDAFLGTLYRVVDYSKTGKSLRIVDPKYCDIAFSNVLKFFDFFEYLLKLNSISLFNRNFDTIMEFKKEELLEDITGKIQILKKCIESERSRPHTEQEKKVLEEQKALVLEYIDKGLIPIGRQVFLQELKSRKETEKSLDK